MSPSAFSCFAKVHVSCLLRVLCSTLFSLSSPATDITFDSESMCISKVVSLLQNLAEISGSLQSSTIFTLHTFNLSDLEHFPIKLGTRALARRDGNDIVMDTGIYQDASSRFAFVEAINPQILDIDAADLDVELLGEDGELDTATPRVLALDPTAVVVG
jgi:hypothetical protein